MYNKLPVRENPYYCLKLLKNIPFMYTMDNDQKKDLAHWQMVMGEEMQRRLGGMVTKDLKLEFIYIRPLPPSPKLAPQQELYLYN